MAKGSSKKRTRNRASTGRRAKRDANSSKPLPWKSWAGWIGAAAAVVAIGVFVVLNSSTTVADPETAALAEAASGGPVEIYTGSAHTVYHSPAPLPTSARPRLDGKPTLVWFSGTWCEFCEVMDPFAYTVATSFTDRLVFVEKSVDHDLSAASRYGILGTPTFVLIDENGSRVSQFSFQGTAESFAAAIEQGLQTGGY